jgi:hypothetical protein
MTTEVQDFRQLPPVIEAVERPAGASQTLLSRLDVCPRSAYLGLKYRYGPSSHPMARGEVFHEFAERATRLLIDQGEPSMPGEVARDLQQAVIEERTDLVLPHREQDACRLMAWNWGEATVLDLESIVAIESTFQMELSGWTHRGRIDRAEVRGTRADIYDYKTSLNITNQEDAERDFQLWDYGLLVAQGKIEDRPFGVADGINEFHLHLVFPRYTTEETGELISRDVAVSRGQLGEFAFTVQRLLEILDHGLETGEWPAVSGSHCSECPCRPECPIPEQLHDLLEIENLADAEAMAELWHQDNARVARMKRTLKAWAQEHGPIFYGDYALDFKAQEKREIRDWPALLLAIDRTLSYGEPFDVNAHRRVTQSTRFDKRKQTEEERDE